MWLDRAAIAEKVSDGSAATVLDAVAVRIMSIPDFSTGVVVREIEYATRIVLVGQPDALAANRRAVEDHLARWRVENEVEAGDGHADLLLIGTDVTGLSEARRIASKARKAGVQFAALALTGRPEPLADIDGFDLVAVSDGAEALAMVCHMLLPIASLICWDLGDVRRICEERIMSVKSVPRSEAQAAIYYAADDPAVDGVVFWAPNSRLIEIDSWYRYALTNPRGEEIDHLFGSDAAWEIEEPLLVGQLFQNLS